MSVEYFAGDNEMWANVDFTDQTIPAWCLELGLLEHGLAESISLHAVNNEYVIHVSLGPELPRVGTFELGEREAYARITRTELERWIVFYLGYYRDGYGDVYHLDVELSSDRGRAESEFVITLTVPRARPAGRGEDLRAALDLLDQTDP